MLIRSHDAQSCQKVGFSINMKTALKNALIAKKNPAKTPVRLQIRMYRVKRIECDLPFKYLPSFEFRSNICVFINRKTLIKGGFLTEETTAKANKPAVLLITQPFNIKHMSRVIARCRVILRQFHYVNTLELLNPSLLRSNNFFCSNHRFYASNGKDKMKLCKRKLKEIRHKNAQTRCAQFYDF